MGKSNANSRLFDSTAGGDAAASKTITVLNTVDVSADTLKKIRETLSQPEQDVIMLWLGGKPKYEAWAKVMRPGLEITDKNYKSIRTQSSRFWAAKRINDIVGEIEEFKTAPKSVSQPQHSTPQRQNDGQSSRPLPESSTTNNTAKKRSYAEQRQAWIESFQDIENPQASTPYGLGLWLGARVIAQVNKREEYIRANKTSPFDKDGCPYTNVDISAVKTVLAALLPFAPAPTQQELKQLTTAGLIISLTAEEMGINPDEYVAPTPPGVRPAVVEVIDTTAETQSEKFNDE